MKAAVLHGASDLRYEEVQRPTPSSDEVLVKIRVNGLCGSDIHFYDEGKLGPFRVSEPYIPGHEASGVVVHSPSSGVPAEGTRVAIEPGVPCRRCEWCKTGRYNLCPDVVFMSAPPVNGTFAEYAAVAADFAHPIPDAVGDEAAAFAEPISVAVQAANRAGLHAGDTVAVVGAGPIGLVTALVARAYGAAQVYVVDRLPHRLELAEELGATAAIAVPSQSVDAEVQALEPANVLSDHTGGRMADVVFDAAGNDAACASTPSLAKRGGVVTLIGWPQSRTVAFPIEDVLEKELDVRGVNRYCNTFPTAIALLASGALEVSPLVSHRFPFEEVTDAFAFASTNRSETVKVMIGALS
jgi:L-iditol 2-dehydrogenase